MYSGSGAQVCTNAPPLPAFDGRGSNHGYSPYGNGSRSVFPNAPPFFMPAGCCPYPPQDYRNFGPIDTRYNQHSKDQKCNVFQAPVGPPMPPMNMPAPFMQFGGQFPPFPPPMQPQTHYFPQNGVVVNQFSNPPPYPPPYPNVIHNGNNNNNGNSFNGRKFHSFRPTERKFIPKKTKSFHCGSCDKDFNTAKRYEQHISEHVSCCLDGCTFKAHPSIVEKHIAMQHRNGLYQRIVKGDSPEEIEKWVTDRKKLYPTLRKITEKQVQKIEMNKRGERYDDRRRGFHDRNKNSNDARNNPKFPYGNRKPFGCNAKRINSKSDSTNQTPNRSFKTPAKERQQRNSVVSSFEFKRNLPAFQGTKYYLQCQTKNDELGHSNSDSDEGSLNFSTVPVNSDKVTISDKPFHPISSLELIRGYDSSDDTNDDCDEPETNSAIKPELPSLNNGDHSLKDECSSKPSLFDASTKSDSYPQNENDDDSGPEECSSKLPVPDFILQDSTVKPVNNEGGGMESVSPELVNLESQNKSSPNEEKNEGNTSKKSTRKRVHKKNRNEKVDDKAESVEKKEPVKDEDKSATVIPRKRFRRPTLLEKLLAPEIRHERNTILQCIRYVVNNNYFDIGSTSAADTSSR